MKSRCYAHQVIAATAIPNIKVIMGPQRHRSAAEGVIQFSAALTKLTATAPHPVQIGQPVQNPSAERIARAIQSRSTIEKAAITRPDGGSSPST